MTNKKNIYPWVLVGLLWVVALLNYLDRQMLATMRPSMQIDIAELRAATYFGNLMAVFLWIYGLFSPLSGFFSDRYNRKWIIVGSLAVWSLVTFLMGHADSYEQLYLLRAVMGVSEALYIPAGLSLIADFHSSRTRSLAIGIHMTGLYAGQALGGFGATVAAAYSWQYTFHVFGLVGVGYAIVLTFLLKSKPAKEQGQLQPNPIIIEVSALRNLKLLLTNGAFWIMLLYFTIPSLPGWAIKNWLPTLFASSLNIDMSYAGPTATITIAVSSLLGVIFGGILSDRWIQRNVKGRIYTSGIGMALTIPSLILLGFGHSLVAVVGAAFCFGFGFGMFDANNMPILCQLVSAKSRATAYGFMNMMGVFAGAMVTDILGKSTDAGHLGRDLAMLSGFLVVGLFLMLYFLRPKHREYKEAL